MYLFLLKKKPQEQALLWNSIKAEENCKGSGLKESLDEYVSASGKKNIDERISVAVLLYNALAHLKQEGIADEMGTMKKDSYGKPYLDGTEVKISISHADNIVALAVEKNRDIGVDIEAEILPERAAKLEKRFLSDFNMDAVKLANNPHTSGDNTELSVLELIDGDFIPQTLFPADNSFTEKWTLSEAIMKCDGRGFSALHEIAALAYKMRHTSFIYCFEGKSIYISIASK